MFGLQKQSFESYLEELLAHCEWEQIEYNQCKSWI